MTDNEKDLVAALEADVQKWDFLAGFFEHSITEMEVIGGKKISGKDYAGGLRKQIAEHRDLIEKVKQG